MLRHRVEDVAGGTGQRDEEAEAQEVAVAVVAVCVDGVQLARVAGLRVARLWRGEHTTSCHHRPIIT